MTTLVAGKNHSTGEWLRNPDTGNIVVGTEPTCISAWYRSHLINAYGDQAKAHFSQVEIHELPDDIGTDLEPTCEIDHG